MRMLTSSIVLGVILSAAALPARADEIMVDGKPCNTFCQSWLGISGPATRPADVVPQTMAEPALIRRAAPLALEAPARPVATRPSRLRTAAREVGPGPDLTVPSAVKASVLRDPEATSGRRTAPLATGASLRDPVRAPSPVRPTASEPSRAVAVAPRPPQQLEPSPALDVVAEPDASEFAPRPAPQRRPARTAKRRVMTGTTEPAMEPGLKDMPRLSDIVAVHGIIIVDTAEDRALARRQQARLVDATTRPKQFRTGFAAPLMDKPVGNDLVGQIR